MKALLNNNNEQKILEYIFKYYYLSMYIVKDILFISLEMFLYYFKKPKSRAERMMSGVF